MCCERPNSQSSSCVWMPVKTIFHCRHYLTKEEQRIMLEEYKKQLENELLGVNQEIKELTK
ncbi:MAG: hypothetical protein RBG13Loki_2385 [Promethearchaeota archaeon CR_4]|nr:MAG: hypothetical protein RBG13Loki_2385 [Candidatus Lokiarchaeota archaeon CR_4]